MAYIPSSEITPERVYHSRRRFIAGLGTLAGSIALAACSPVEAPSAPASAGAEAGAAAAAAPEPKASRETDDLGQPLNSYQQITNYNNYYEFSTDKVLVASMSKDLRTRPWTVEVGGLVNRPKTYDVDELVRKFTPEERIYRLRCVEAWSMVIPWLGFPLAELLKEVEPASTAKYVRFTSLHDPAQMPGQGDPWYVWPYVEGLRLDEAMHDLTLLSTGLYGRPLPPQDGAPIRLVVPWKYGFKSIKAIVRIDLVTEQPVSLWMTAAPDEYGFYANVNPDVPHPRWSQATERRIGSLKRIATLPFNGYADQVAPLYAGMDLHANY